MDWDKLRIFHAVADAGSLTHAGDTLHLSQSAVSRQIRSLEESLNAILFHRHARGLILTEQGELLFDATKSMSKRIDAASARIKDSEEEIYGELRVTTTIGFGSLWLAPRLPKLYEAYPQLKIDLMLEERVLDLPMREADVAIRMRRPKQLNYIQKKLIDLKYYMYGSNKYLEKYGMPKTVGDLNKHKFISFGKGAPSPVYNPEWALKLGMHDGKKRKPIMKVNSVMGLLLAVETGVGLAALPEYLVSNSSNIIKVLPKSEGPITEAHFVYPQSLKNTARVTAFRNFLFSKIGDWKS